MKTYLLGVSAVILALAGCDPVSERDCGVFDHPDLTSWQADAYQDGSIVTFMSEGGLMREFRREAAVTNEAFLGTDGSSNDEDVLCELTAVVRLQATDGSLAIISTYQQQELLLIESADEVLVVTHSLEAPAGAALAGDFRADITIDSARINIDPERVIYLEDEQTSEEIGGQAYEDVVRINAPAALPTADGGSEPVSDYVTQIVMARQFGIVAFTDAENRNFVRVATP